MLMIMLKLYLRKSLTCEFLWLLDFCSWWVAPLILKVLEIAANQRWRGSESRWRPRSCWPAQRRSSSASSSSLARSTSDRPAMISSVFNLTKSLDERASILIQFKIYNIFHKKQLQFWFSFTFKFLQQETTATDPILKEQNLYRSLQYIQ